MYSKKLAIFFWSANKEKMMRTFAKFSLLDLAEEGWSLWHLCTHVARSAFTNLLYVIELKVLEGTQGQRLVLLRLVLGLCFVPSNQVIWPNISPHLFNLQLHSSWKGPSCPRHCPPLHLASLYILFELHRLETFKNKREDDCNIVVVNVDSSIVKTTRRVSVKNIWDWTRGCSS